MYCDVLSSACRSGQLTLRGCTLGRLTGETALNVAVRSGQRALVTLLLDSGAGANAMMPDSARAVPPLFHSVWLQSADIFKLLLDRGADPRLRSASGSSVLMPALRWGRCCFGMQ